VGKGVGKSPGRSERLTPAEVLRALKGNVPSLLADGDGLYLQQKKHGGSSWIYRFKMGGRKNSRYIGLGSYPRVSLLDARKKAAVARTLKNSGIDPIEKRRKERAVNVTAGIKHKTFKKAALEYIAKHHTEWNNPKHRQQWPSSLQKYAFPLLGFVAVQSIDTELVVRVLQPIWSQKPETARRLRGRIENVLDFSTANGWRVGENPARWRGALQHILAPKTLVHSVNHFPALPYDEVSNFIYELRAYDGLAARALEFLILTASRTCEVVAARWSDLDFEAGVWLASRGRWQTGHSHNLPLSRPVLQLLECLDHDHQAFVFPGGSDNHLSNGAMLALLHRMGRSYITAHGFRLTFRNWAAECTKYPRELVDAALSDVASNKMRMVYGSSDLFQKKRLLLNAWASYCVSDRVAHNLR